MDVSTSIMSDPKVRKLLRIAPDRFPVAMTAYLGLMAESWKAGRRLSVEDSWPLGMTFDQLAVEALQHVDLIDAGGFINAKTWRSWFGKAKNRRAKSRADWRRYQQDKRNRQRGVSTDTSGTPAYPSVPPVRPSEPSVPTEGERDVERNNGAHDPSGSRHLRPVDPSARTA